MAAMVAVHGVIGALRSLDPAGLITGNLDSPCVTGRFDPHACFSPRASCSTHCDESCFLPLGLPCGMKAIRRWSTDHGDYDGWMSRFCHEPISDASNGVLGVFLPCLLYGKVKWRIRQISKGRDYNDSNFEWQDAFNRHCGRCFLSCI